MEIFSKTRAVKLRGHHGKYLVADDDQQTVRQSRYSSSRRARWLVEAVDGNPHAVRLKSCHGRYLTASYAPFLLGMTGNKVLQTIPHSMKEPTIEWEPIKEEFKVKFRAFGGTYLRANGGTPPWRNSVTHDSPYTSSTHHWILWELEAAPENESAVDYSSPISSFSSFSDDLHGSPESMYSSGTPSLSMNVKKIGMDLFRNAKAVRLRSHHGKYLHAEEDEETVSQNRDGSAKSARWTVEMADGAENVIRLKSYYGKYLTASNLPFLLGMTGRKVLQTMPHRLDSSVEWEPVIEEGGGVRVKLKTRYGQFLRANGGVPPWRNSVTHDVPHRTATQDWVLWEVDVVEIVVLQSPHPMPPAPSTQLSDSNSFVSAPASPSSLSAVSTATTLARQESNLPSQSQLSHSNSFASAPASPSSDHSAISTSASTLRRHESSESFGSLLPSDGRVIYYQTADKFGNVDESLEGFYITFKGNEVDELTERLEEETGLKDIIVCSRSPLNGKLYPLRLQLPPNNAPMHVVLVHSLSRVARSFARTGIPI